jgi:uncharacterized protein YjiS (DUF1127 family)
MIKCINIRLLDALGEGMRCTAAHFRRSTDRRKTMTTLQTSATGTTFTLALVRMAVRQVRSFGQALANRRAVTALHGLDDRALKDIGLTRADVQGALALPMGHDPSRHLAALRGGVEPSKPVPLVTAQRWNRARRTDAGVSARAVRA